MMNKEESDHQEESFLKPKKSSVSIFGAFKDACKTRPSSVNFHSSLESSNQENKASLINQQPQSPFIVHPGASDQMMIYRGSVPESMTSSEPLKYKKNKKTSSERVTDSIASGTVLNHFSSGYILNTSASGHLMDVNPPWTWKSASDRSSPVSSLGSIISGSSPESTDSIQNSRDFSTFLLMANEIAHRQRIQQEIEYLNQKKIKKPENLHSSLGCLNQENRTSFSNQQLQGQYMSQRSTSEQMLTYPGSISESVAASGTRKKKIPLRKRSKSMTLSGNSSASMNLVRNSLHSTNLRRMNTTSDQGQYQYLHQQENNFLSNQQTTPVRRKRKLLSLAEDEVDHQEDEVDTFENEQPIDLTTIIKVFNCM